MRANEFITEKKKRKKIKVRRAAYGPGPYGLYGYDAGYSGASDGGGDGGGGESIHELFDGGKDWKWTYQDKNQASAEFTVGSVHYTFMAGQDPDEAPGDWDIEFAAKQQHGTASWGVTGTGNSAQVFGTVVEIMKAFITSKKASIRRMTFAAKEDSRQGLYARMVKRLLPKWNLEQKGEAFVLTRPGGLVFWVYSVEAPYNKIPPVKVKANTAQEAEQIVLTTMPEFKGADRMGMGASKNKPNLNETVISETAMMGKIADSGKIIRILKKAHTVPFSDEKNWLLVDMDPAKGNKGLGIKWIPADTRFEWVRPYRDSIDENFANPAKAYRAHLIKTLPQIMKLFANIGKGWIPSKEQMLSAVDNAYQVMKHTGDAKQAGKVLMDELNTLYRMSKNKQDVAENFADGRNPQDKGDSKRHGVPTKGSVSTLRNVAKQGGRKGQLAHWMANMKSGRAKNK